MTIINNIYNIKNESLSTLLNIVMGIFVIWFAHQVVRYIRTYVKLDKFYQKLQKAEMMSAFKDTFSIYYKNNDVLLTTLGSDSVFNEIQTMFILSTERMSRNIFQIIIKLLEAIVALATTIVYKTVIWVKTSLALQI